MMASSRITSTCTCLHSTHLLTTPPHTSAISTAIIYQLVKSKQKNPFASPNQTPATAPALTTHKMDLLTAKKISWFFIYHQTWCHSKPVRYLTTTQASSSSSQLSQWYACNVARFKEKPHAAIWMKQLCSLLLRILKYRDVNILIIKQFINRRMQRNS